jgi:nitrogen fixation protein NifU and related proteins
MSESARAQHDPRYSAEVQRRFQSFAGAGKLEPGPDVTHGSAGDREQGAAIELDARIEAGRVAAATFLAFGCPHVIAAASWLTEHMVGFDRHQLEAWDWQEVAWVLAVPPAKYARLLTLQDALRDLARNWPVATGSTV